MRQKRVDMRLDQCGCIAQCAIADGTLDERISVQSKQIAHDQERRLACPPVASPIDRSWPTMPSVEERPLPYRECAMGFDLAPHRGRFQRQTLRAPREV